MSLQSSAPSRPKRYDRLIKDLQRRFGVFRTKRARGGGRVPRDLRESVLAALETGVDPAALRRACGVTQRQLTRWQREAGKAKAGWRRGLSAEPQAAPKILSVVDAVRSSAIDTHDEHMASVPGVGLIEVEVRLGGQAVRVRLSS